MTTDVASPTHASRHATGGADPITPASIGAATTAALAAKADTSALAAKADASALTAKVDKTTVTTKGDILAATGSGTVTRQGVGADGSVLIADSSQASGLKYGSVPYPGPSYNILPQNFKTWRKATAKVRAGVGPAKLFCVGDSTTAGAGIGTYAQNYPSMLAKLLDAYYIPAAQTWAFPHAGTSDAGALDPRIDVAHGFTNNGLAWSNAPSTPGTSFYKPSSCGGPTTVDTLEVYTLRNSGQGAITVNVNGGATLGTVDSNGAGPSVLKTVISLGSVLTNPTINFATVGGTPGTNYILGLNAYDSTKPQVQVANIGQSGTKTDDWIDASTPYSIQNFVATYAPDLTIIDLGINDVPVPNSQATYTAHMQTIISRSLNASGDVLLKSMCPTDTTQYDTLERQYVVAMNALSVTNSIGFLDTFSRWVSHAVSDAAGYFTDAAHPTPFGYSDIAQAVFNLLKTI